MKYLSLLLTFFVLFSCSKSKTLKKDSVNKTITDTIVFKNDSIVDIIHCPGPERNPNTPFYFMTVDSPPKFKNTPKNLSIFEELKVFQEKIRDIIRDNFAISQGHLVLSGTNRIYIQFEIGKKGNIQNIKIRAPHPALEKEAKRVIKLFPPFIPAKHEGKIVSTIYNLPIIFKVED